ncbi:MAG: hypothetical protein IPN90_08775 [Elusimicrobia bacterium]|nr:hypothetical protein [Elusimicrobiota bacterium]
MPADGEKVDRLMSSLRYLSADDFVDPPESLGPIADSLRPPSAELTVTLGPGGASGKTHILCFGRPDKRDPSRVLLRRDTDPHLLWVIVSHFDVLNVNIKDLLSK